MKKVLVLGDVIIDHFIFGSINRMSPEDPTIPVVDVLREEYRLGGAANVACNIKSLGETVDVTIASIVSEFTLNKLNNNRISLLNNYKIFLEDESKPCVTNELIKTRVINTNNNKQIVRIDNRLKYSSYDVIAFTKDFGAFFDEFEFDAIVVSDYDKLVVNNKIIDLLESCTCPIFIDTKKPDLSIWDKIKFPIIKLNKKEYESCLKKNSEVAKTIPILIVTKSEEGSDLYANGILKKTITAEKVANPDVCGAGDVYLGALVVKCLEGVNIEKACEYATKAASISVKKQGTTVITQQDF